MSPSKKYSKNKIVLTTVQQTSTSTPNSTASLKYRPNTETTRETAKGKLPCAEGTSIQQVITMMFVHICRKILYGFDMSYRIGFYILGTLLISVVGDYKPSPVASRAYFADSNNFFNQWFVKLGWGWTILAVGSFNYMTVNTYSCGRSNIVRRNLLRLGIATVIWFVMTNMFQIIENRTGVCELLKYARKETCMAHGFMWKGFDISGHCFLLIFCNLFIIEEGKAYLGWERIKDYLRLEEHKRINNIKDASETPLAKLKNEEFLWLRHNFTTSTISVRCIFCMMAVLSILWDLMFLATIFYFHLMIEKVVASGVAVLLWFSLYKCFYQQEMSPGLPGEGIFKYVTWTDPSLIKKSTKTSQKSSDKTAKWTAQDDVPKFMGMPLYALRDYKEDVVPEDLVKDSASAVSKRTSLAGGRRGSISDLSLVRPLGRARSRSQSKTRLSSSKNSLNVRF